VIDPSAGLIRLLQTLDLLEIQYMIGGSGASSFHSIWRATADIDIVALLRANDIDPLVDELQRDFYADASQIRMAIERGRSFNLIHIPTSYKFDIFPLSSDPYQQVQFGRRRFEQAKVFGTEPIEFAVATAEDVILSKLRWYRLGGETSDQQWNDVLGVISVQGERLDLAYLRELARYLKVDDLLDQALTERHEPM
jgi:hypothetical protein